MRSLWWSTCGIWKPHSIAKTVSKYLTQYIDVWIDAYASSKISLRQIEDVFSQLWSPEICYIWSMGSDGQLFPEEICQKHHSILQVNVMFVWFWCTDFCTRINWQAVFQIPGREWSTLKICMNHPLNSNTSTYILGFLEILTCSCILRIKI